MSFSRRLLSDWNDDDDWDRDWQDQQDDFDKRWEETRSNIEDAHRISVGIIIAIVVGIILFCIGSVIICIYCVCKKRRFSSGTVVQRGGPQPQVTTYSFPQTAPPPGMVPPQQPVQPQGYGHGYPPAMAGPAQPYPPVTAGGWTQPAPGVASPPPPYTPPQPAPYGFAEKQKASAPPME